MAMCLSYPSFSALYQTSSHLSCASCLALSFSIGYSAVKTVVVRFSVMSQNVVYPERSFLSDNTLPTLSGLVQDWVALHRWCNTHIAHIAHIAYIARIAQCPLCPKRVLSLSHCTSVAWSPLCKRLKCFETWTIIVAALRKTRLSRLKIHNRLRTAISNDDDNDHDDSTAAVVAVSQHPGSILATSLLDFPSALQQQRSNGLLLFLPLRHRHCPSSKPYSNTFICGI